MIPSYFILSEWIFILSILYYLNIIPYNPLPLLYIALTSNISMWFYLIYKYFKNENENSKETIYKQLFNMTIIKFIPFYLIGNTKIQEKDIIFCFFIFIFYSIFLGLNDMNPIELYIKICKSMIENKDELPLYVLYSRIRLIFENKIE